MIYVEAPNTTIDSHISIFLAGAITSAPEWQTDLISLIRPLEITVFNPRRANFPIHDPNAAFEQIKWEFIHLRKATFISFWFCKETLCPITLFELGAHLGTGKPLIIGMNPEYARRQDIEIQTKLIRPDVPIVYSLKALSDEIFKTYNNILKYI